MARTLRHDRSLRALLGLRRERVDRTPPHDLVLPDGFRAMTHRLAPPSTTVVVSQRGVFLISMHPFAPHELAAHARAIGHHLGVEVVPLLVGGSHDESSVAVVGPDHLRSFLAAYRSERLDWATYKRIVATLEAA